MFRGFVLILFLAASAANAQGIRHDARSNSAPQQAHQNPKPEIQPSDLAAIQSAINRIGTALDAANNKANSAEENDRAKRDLAAQEKVAEWAPAVFWVALVELIVTTVGVILIYLTIRETRRIGQAQVRAYVDVAAATISFGWGDGSVTVGITAINAGQSPALNFQWVPTVQYVFGERAHERSISPMLGPNRGMRIPAKDQREDRTEVGDMNIATFAADSTAPTANVVLRVRIKFRFTDVFGTKVEDVAYFDGRASISGQAWSAGGGYDIWQGHLNPMPVWRDWDQRSVAERK